MAPVGMSKTTVQNKTFQKRMLEGADKEGYAGYYWYVGARVPYTQRINKAQEEVFVSYPPRLVPLIPVAPDPDATRRIAEMVRWLHRPYWPTDETAVGLIHEESLTNIPWYIWSEPVTTDMVCGECGAVTSIDDFLFECGWICRDCRRKCEHFSG